MKVKEAVMNARKAFQGWTRLSVNERTEYMKKISEMLETEKEGFIKLIMEEVGKPRIEAETEVLDTFAAVNHYSEEILKVKAKEMKFDQ
ncbi:MAG: aldehyde dehydrogenase family protein, partial [archaeon]